MPKDCGRSPRRTLSRLSLSSLLTRNEMDQLRKINAAKTRKGKKGFWWYTLVFAVLARGTDRHHCFSMFVLGGWRLKQWLWTGRCVTIVQLVKDGKKCVAQVSKY